MKNNLFENLLEPIDDIYRSIDKLCSIELDEYESLTEEEQAYLVSKLENIEFSVLKDLKTEIEEMETNSEDFDFEQSGGKDIQVYLQYQYKSEDDDTVTYEYTIDGGGTTDNIDISKEYLIEELNKGEEINDIILSEIECNSF